MNWRSYESYPHPHSLKFPQFQRYMEDFSGALFIDSNSHENSENERMSKHYEARFSLAVLTKNAGEKMGIKNGWLHSASAANGRHKEARAGVGLFVSV